jgi:CheY-like chemotaxis protein
VKTILVVDDEPTLRAVVADVLQDEGYSVLEAAHGRAMLEILEREHPALVLMDVMMPVLDGQAAYQELRARQDLPDIPVVMMSAAAHHAELDPAIAGFMRKPFDLIELVAVVTALIGPPQPDDHA